jgi:DNA polymerase sigma
MSDTDKAILKRFRQLVSGRLRIRELTLFGSRARGEAAPHSDMDVLLVVDGPVDAAAEDFVSDCAWEAGFEHGVVLVPVVFSRDQWERGPERSSLLAKAVRAEGVPA